MPQTLKEKYQQKRVVEVQNKLKKIDALLIESHQLKLINEALEENIEDVKKVVEKLRAIENIIEADPSKKKSDLTAILTKQMDEVNAAVNKEKGRLSKLWQKFKPSDNPVNKVLVFIAALEEGFKVLPTIVKNNIKDVAAEGNKEKSIDEILGSIGGKPSPDAAQQKTLDTIQNSFIKAFVTKGKLASIKYDPNKDGLKDFLFALTSLKLETLEKLAGTIKQGPQASTTADDAKVTEPQQGTSDASGKKVELTPQQQKAQVVAVQTAAKEAGITEEETVTRFLSDVMEWRDGVKNPNADIAIKVLKDYALRKKVAKGQLDGFVDGITIDQNKMKSEIQSLVKAAQEAKSKKEKEGEAKSTGGGQIGNAMMGT